MSKLREINRRELLQFLGLTGANAMLSPLNMLTQSIISGAVTKACAAEMSLNPRRLLYISLPGGPARWTFDFFLNPYGSAGFTRNAQAVTKYTEVAGRYVDAEYSTVLVKGIQAPWQWQFNLPTADGGSRPMSDLLNHLLALQGLNSGSDSHDISRMNILTPLGALQSLTAMPADASNAPIKSASAEVYDMVFRSQKGFSNVAIPNRNQVTSSDNLLQTLMDPFTNKTGATFNDKKAQLKSYLDTSAASLSAYAQSEHPGAATLAADQRSATELLGKALGDMSTYWTNAVAKYESLIMRALDRANPLPGLTDLPVGTTGTRNFFYRTNLDGSMATQADLRDLLPADGKFGFLARHMALAEYLFVNKLTHSLSIGPGMMATPDEHGTGKMVSLIKNTYNWRAYAACLLELITQLKAANVFQDTVIAMIGDFNRTPRNDGFGSDHGSGAASAVFYSGAVQGPMILGRMQANSRPDSANRGTSSSGSVGTGDGSRDYASMMSSAAALIRVPSPITAKFSMVSEVNGVIVANSEKSTLY